MSGTCPEWFPPSEKQRPQIQLDIYRTAPGHRARPSETGVGNAACSKWWHLNANTIVISSLNSISSGSLPAPSPLSPKKYLRRKYKSTFIIHLEKKYMQLWLFVSASGQFQNPAVAVDSKGSCNSHLTRTAERCQSGLLSGITQGLEGGRSLNEP